MNDGCPGEAKLEADRALILFCQEVKLRPV